MKLSEEQAAKLLQKYNSGEASDQQVQVVEHWYASESLRQQQEPVELDYLLVNAQIWDRVAAQTARTAHEPVVRSRYGVIGRWAAAAAVLVMIGAGIIFYVKKPAFSPTEVVSYMNDVAPGTTSATLTLSSGRKIFLASAAQGELTGEAGVSILKTADGELIYQVKDGSGQPNKTNTLSTANGETYRVRLPDGTSAWLNAASSISYPASFASMKTRKVTTSGEVYFEVAKDRTHPFIVQSKGQSLEVLGTHFNVNGYGDEAMVRTTLVEGSVRLKGSSGSEGLLRPGQQAAMGSSGEFRISEVDTELATAWKNNKFMFEGQQIRDIMRMVERWYNVRVIYEGPVPEDRYSGTVSRFGNVSQVLKILEESGGVHFRITGGEGSVEKAIYVSK